MALVFALILVLMLVFVLIGIVSALAWLLWTVILAVAVAVIAGLVFSALLTGVADPWSSTALLTGGAVFVLALSLSRSIGRRRREARLNRYRRPIIDVKPVPAPRPAPPPPPEPVDAIDPVLGNAFARLADRADFARSRISMARTSCARFLAAAERHPDHGPAADLAVLIRKHVPEHVDECLAACRNATALEARGLLEEAVVDLERLGARADKRRSALIEADGPGKRRSLLARRLDNEDPFG